MSSFISMIIDDLSHLSRLMTDDEFSNIFDNLPVYTLVFFMTLYLIPSKV